MKMISLSSMLFILFVYVLLGCQKEKHENGKDILKDKLVGHWIETAPRDTVSGLKAFFYEDDTILIEERWKPEIPDERFRYAIISSDSLKIIRGIDLITYHRITFYALDSIEITDFADIDLIWGFTDVTLYKIE
ncbi:MAG: hypothetical protein ABFS10_11405 [Bacteroidota bacterium]